MHKRKIYTLDLSEHYKINKIKNKKTFDLAAIQITLLEF